MERISIETERLRIGEWMPELAGTLCCLSQNEGNRLFLPDPVRAVGRLVLRCHIPPRIVVNYNICRR